MIKALFSIFKPDPIKKLNKTREIKYKQAVELQRNGNLREYAVVMKEIEILEDEILKLVEKNNQKSL